MRDEELNALIRTMMIKQQMDPTSITEEEDLLMSIWELRNILKKRGRMPRQQWIISKNSVWETILIFVVSRKNLSTPQQYFYEKYPGRKINIMVRTILNKFVLEYILHLADELRNQKQGPEIEPMRDIGI